MGPYRLWHHEHFFRAVPGGTAVEDIVHYAVPCGWLGRAVAGWWVDRQLARIFDFRRQALATRFPGPTA
jgi:ligand-binding SRPBCC domain-containing protein